jgi:hypothetical protein
MERLRTPEQIVADMRRERIREAVAAEIAERGSTTLGRISRRTGLPREEVEALVPGSEIGEELSVSQHGDVVALAA